jgi:mannose-6-phosphate isomerase class I
MGGQNLSLQVHPMTEYIRSRFGMTYTQDESYYILDAKENSGVYLGLREGIDMQMMADDLRAAEAGKISFPAEKYVNFFPYKKHDHFLIPAGTIHCSAADTMVLEISATPYNFTFKLWDWDRVGLDGLPRPIHIEDGLANIQWNRTTAWVRENLVNQFEALSQTEDVMEERTGLHEYEFIETRRFTQTGKSYHDAGDGFHICNLIDGREAVIESEEGAFAPYTVHYAETFIIPAAAGRYTVRPAAPGEKIVFVKAYVRNR